MKKRIAAVAAAAFVCIILTSTIRAQQLQQDMAGRVLRFHVLANSDGEADQNLKRKVRDAVGTMMVERLRGADSLQESRRIAEASLPEIERTAAETIKSEGYSYPVQAAVVTDSFPEKDYGPFTFPAGRYEALRVVIGEGRGHNWWCVMYPNLCFSGSMYEVDAQSGEKLREVLSEEEYQAVLQNGDYEIKFKILGFLNRILD